MKKITIMVGVLIALAALLITFNTQAQNQPAHMKISTGIVTRKLKESKSFYEKLFNFGVTFENEFYILMHSPDRQTHISFLQADHPTQQPVFQSVFGGKGMYFTIEVADVDAEYERIKKIGVPVTITIRDEPWGDRHFAVTDPNGVGIDIVTYTPPNEN